MSLEYRVNAAVSAQDLKSLLDQTGWAKNREPDQIKLMLKKSPLHVSAWLDGKLIGFGRALTDHAYRAVIDDVVVETSLRGSGIGGQLIKRLTEELKDVEEVFLGCGESEVKYYQRHGFKRVNNPYMKLAR